MKDGRYVVGVCLTNIYLEHERNFLKALNDLSKEYPVKVLVFQCFFDRFKTGANSKTASSIYKVINYDLIDVLVVNSYSIANDSVINDIVNNAKAHNVPMVSLDRGIKEKVDVVVTNDRIAAFASVIEHMINDHGVKDIFYMSGHKGDPISDIREKLFREIMQKNGLCVDESKIAHCDFWRVKTREILEERFGHGEKLPEAFICGNDVAAQETCDFVFSIGKSVPEDVLVSGFDGFDVNGLFTPILTTVSLDYRDHARQVLESAMNLINKDAAPGMVYSKSKLIKGETCGCTVMNKAKWVMSNYTLYQKYTDRSHMDNVLFGINNIDMASQDINAIRENLLGAMINSSAILVNSDFFATDGDMGRHTNDNPFTNKMIMICGKDRFGDLYEIRDVNLRDMAPFDVRRIDDTGKITVFTPIVSQKNVYGYFLCDFDDFEDEAFNLQIFSRMLNMAVGLRDKTLSNNSLSNMMDQIVKRDSLTNLYNSIGLKEQFEKLYEDDPERSRYKLVVSLYTIAGWQYIFQNFGMEDANFSTMMAADGLKIANPKDTIIGRVSNDNFVIINYMAPTEDEGAIINEATKNFYKIMETANKTSGKGYYVEVNAGCTVVSPGFKGTLSDLVKIANNEMLINRLRFNDPEERKKAKNSLEKEQKFLKLIDKNMFFYNFQPIVDATNGEIYAYEALMRAPQEIGLSPIEILDIATDLGRLYDIERATMFNILDTYHAKIEQFRNKKIFINSIPGHTLSEQDFESVMSKHKNIADNVVIEITEQNARTDVEMERFMRMVAAFNSQFAVDDYGSGNSNIVNLLKFSPNVIKIDRYLVENINENVNKQMFVKNIIEFAQKNNIKVIAEGVETKEEMETVIKFGVNLIQGYYTARPNIEPIIDIASDIKQNIIEQYKMHNVNG